MGLAFGVVRPYGSDDTNKISSFLLLLNIFYDRYFNRMEHIDEEIIILLIIGKFLGVLDFDQGHILTFCDIELYPM